MTCKGCGGETDKRGRLYCSVACACRSINTARAQPAKVASCAECGQQFTVRTSARDTYCSRPCAQAAWQRRAQAIAADKRQAAAARRALRQAERDAKRAEPRPKWTPRVRPARPCVRCGVTFQPVPGTKNRRYCSERCLVRERRARQKRRRGGNTHTQRAKHYGCVRRYNVQPAKVFARDKWKCQLCGVRTPERLRGTMHDRAPELDHIVPLALGGAHTYDNVQCACRRCNSAKGATWRGQARLALDDSAVRLKKIAGAATADERRPLDNV